MNRRQSERNNKYQANKRRGRPLIQGITILRILCTILIIFNLWLVYGIFSTSRGIANYRRHRQQVAELEQKVRSVQHENRKLFRQIENFKNDPKVQERVVRQQLGWASEDELVIEFLPPAKDPS